MPESISLLLWQDEVAASCQLERNKWVGEKLLFDASSLWNTYIWHSKRQKAVWRQTSDCGHFGELGSHRRKQNKMEKYNNKSVSNIFLNQIFWATKEYCCRVGVGQGLLPLVPSCWVTGKKISRVGWGTDAHMLYRMFCCYSALLSN